MNKIILKRIILIVLVMVLSVTGCKSISTSGETTDKQVTESIELVIWHDKEKEVAEVLEAILAPLAPGIVVTLEKKDGLTDALKLVGNDPASAPDMYFFAHDKIGVYAEMGILSPITDYLSDEVLSDYMNMTIEAGTYKEVLYQLPIYYETLLFMYNKDLMGGDEVPQTTDELLSYMEEKTVDGKFGFVEQHSTAYYSVAWIHGFGGELVNSLGEPQLTSDEVKSALTYHLKFLEYMPTESEYSTVNTLFLEGYANATINGPWLVPSAREVGIDLGFAPMPLVDETGIPLAPYSGVQGIHVLKVASETKFDAIKTVLETIANPQIGIDIALISGSAPANELCYENEDILSNPMILTMRETAKSAIPMPNIPEMDVMFIVTGNMLVEVNMNGGDIDKATQSNQDKALLLIDAMK